MDRVADAAGEGDGLAALAVLEPVRDDVADELVLVHPLGKLRLDVVARLCSNAAQIRVYRRVDLSLDEIALLDQVGDLRGLDQGRKDASSPRPSPRQGVAVRPSTVASGYAAKTL